MEWNKKLFRGGILRDNMYGGRLKCERKVVGIFGLGKEVLKI